MTVTDLEHSKLLELLAPFQAEQIGKLPRVTCGDCSDRRKRCENKAHIKKRCETCSAYVSPAHIHIDYVGHADVTRRLLEVDLGWVWEPFALDDNGLPLLDVDEFGNPVGMWIRLTVCGVTRPGYGSCPSNQSDAVKVLIGDALRNAAQRFGVALEQWMKGDRANPAAENVVADAGRRAAPARQQASDAQVVVDAGWVSVFEKRLAESDLEHVAGFRQDVIDAMRTQRINSDTANRLLEAVKERQKVLELPADGLPRNKDGSISRRQVTDEQLAEVGVMTRPQTKEHNKLVKETISNPKLADRSNATDATDEVWMNGGAST